MNSVNWKEVIRYRSGINQALDEDGDKVLTRLDDRLRAMISANIVDWVETHYTPDWVDEPIVLEPYQVDPMRAQVTEGVEEVVIIGPERFGKSTIPRCGMLYKMMFNRGPKLIIYEEKRKAGTINMREFHPAVMAVPELRRQIEGKWKARTMSYDLKDCTVDFTGAGADITSTDERDVWVDEYDTWPLTLDKRISQLENVRKRMRLWRNRGEGSMVICSSPKGTVDDSGIWLEYAPMQSGDTVIAQSSMGLWYLRCLSCSELIDSTRIDGVLDKDTNEFRGGLRWETENSVIVPESLRLACPHCGHLHEESDSKQMNAAGEYVHAYPELLDRRPGFLFGSLSSLRGLKWLQIAEQRRIAAKDNSFEVQRTFHNSFRGVAMPLGDETRESERQDILRHCIPVAPEASDIIAIVAGADTQESPWGWFWVVRGIDRQWCTHLLASGFANSKAELEDVLCARRYHGKPIDWAIIDQGGTNADDVKAMAAEHRHIYQYKGASRPTSLWTFSSSQTQIKLLLCDAGRLQIMLLRSIYDQKDRSNSYWYLPPATDVPEDDDPAFDYVTHVAAVRNLMNGKHSHLRQNWDCKPTERRDYFDCEKMLQVLPLVFKREIQHLIDNDGKRKPMKLSEVQQQKRR